MRKLRFEFWFALSGLLARLQMSGAFSFSYTAPKSCDALNVTWTGGTSPFYLVITPPSGTPRNLSIPNAAYNGADGAFSTTLDLAAGRSFILTMSDATGFGSGGSSDLLTVGPSASGTQCNLTDPSTPFTFQIASTLQQCGVYNIGGYNAAVQPVHLQGLIPIGSTFTLDVPAGSSYNYTVNMSSGTKFVLFMQDGDGNLSTASPVEQVASSGDSSCINSSSPHSTLSSVTQEPTANPTVSSSPSQNPSSGKHGNNGAIIGGSVAGALAFLLLIALLIWCIMRRRRDPMQKYTRKRQRKGMDGMRTLDLAGSTPNLNPQISPNHLPPMEFEPEPFILPGGSSNGGEAVPLSPTSHTHSSSNDARLNVSSANMGHTARSPSQATHMSTSNASSKAAMAGSSSGGGLAPPPRFVLHTDAGSIDNVNASTVELPPTYNAAAGQPSPHTTPPAATEASGNTAPDPVPSSGGNTASEGSTPPQPIPEERSSTTHLTAPSHT